MKKLILLCISSAAAVTTLFAQTPTASPTASALAAEPTAGASAIATPATPRPLASGSSSDLADKIHRKLEKKFRGKHGIIIDGGNHEGGDHQSSKDEIPAMVIPLVGIVFLTIFGAPVLIVIAIGFVTLLVTRSRQRTIRMMVEKGQPVPAELLAPATRTVRQRSDVRRGVVLTMTGAGIAIFLAATDWGGSSWTLGLIPFLIGLGYLLIWKLEGKKDIPPPPPAP